MIYPPIGSLIEKADSRYSLVIATAKRARQVSEDKNTEVKKPVIEAIQEIYNGEVEIVTTSNIKADIEEIEE